MCTVAFLQIVLQLQSLFWNMHFSPVAKEYNEDSMDENVAQASKHFFVTCIVGYISKEVLSGIFLPRFGGS